MSDLLKSENYYVGAEIHEQELRKQIDKLKIEDKSNKQLFILMMKKLNEIITMVEESEESRYRNEYAERKESIYLQAKLMRLQAEINYPHDELQRLLELEEARHYEEVENYKAEIILLEELSKLKEKTIELRGVQKEYAKFK